MIGKEILSYRIEKKIGEGGMGTVYSGKHTRIDRKVAIKVLHPHLVKSEAIRHRFINEANTLAAIQHPNIVQLYDYVEQDDNLFLIMEFIEGKSIDAFIKQISGPIPEDKTIIMFRQILDAMYYAHNQNIIHRDIKPGNFIIKPNGQIKILDFGIAKIVDKEEYNLTQTGGKVGTVMYMSPEQVQGKPLDNRSDIYALGVTLFQMLTGKLPYFDAESEFDIQYAIVSKPLPRMANLYPNVSPWIQKIVDKATEKAPELRFQTCADFNTALERPKPKSSIDHLKRIMEDNLDTQFGNQQQNKTEADKTEIKEPPQVTNIEVKTQLEDKTIIENKSHFDAKTVISSPKFSIPKKEEKELKTVETKQPKTENPEKKKKSNGKRLFRWLMFIALFSFIIYLINKNDEPASMPEPDPVQKAETIMENYYHSFTVKQFDAHNFFADTVKQYLMMRKTNPEAINKNINKFYYKEFKDPQNRIETGSMKLISDSAGMQKFNCIVVGQSFRKSKKQYNYTRTLAEVIFNNDFKIISYSYPEVYAEEWFETEEEMIEYIHNSENSPQ